MNIDNTHRILDDSSDNAFTVFSPDRLSQDGCCGNKADVLHAGKNQNSVEADRAAASRLPERTVIDAGRFIFQGQ